MVHQRVKDEKETKEKIKKIQTQIGNRGLPCMLKKFEARNFVTKTYCTLKRAQKLEQIRAFLPPTFMVHYVVFYKNGII